MTESTAPTHDDDDEIDLLDLLLIIAENLKLLIVGPLVIGVAALIAAYCLPKTYESQSILSTNKSGVNISSQVLASYIRSADILMSVADEVGFESQISTEKRLKDLEKRINVSVGKQDQLLTLKTQAYTPEEARVLNAVIWKHVLPLTIPRNKEMERLKVQLQAENERLKSGEKLEAETAQLLSVGTTAEGTARLYGELLASNSARLRTIAALESQMEGLTQENLAQQPTLPEASIKPKKALIAIGATLGSGFLFLLFVFARHTLRGASQNAEQAEKIMRLRRALGMKN